MRISVLGCICAQPVTHSLPNADSGTYDTESLIRCHLAHAGRAQIPKQLQQRAVVKMAVALGDQ